ncbi:hypothetical protein ElyMa_003932400 [Elysia marginata]|uniref:Uncharacterized protein n=1 Tax=Elysia marginata TaxID=1093978 RepID=A0AAV4FU94_9GAST|nr:hypothetical protein ElyMa_003932400 [Elysia marginata]
MEGKINGKRQHGRKRKSWLGNIEETTTRRINDSCEVALDREEWRRTIASNLWQETEQRPPLLLTSLQSTFAVDVASVHLLLFWSGVRPGILTSCWRYLVAEGLDLPGVLATLA